jgi:anaerobic carbon-monoxide dehydrogenase iron sulfur subunit
MATNQSKSRRDFVRNMALGAGALTLMPRFGIIAAQAAGPSTIKAIVVDFSKCTGCRTCETVCSSVNHKVNIGGTMVNGLGNPELSNIRVWHYNPDVDIPVTCFLCADAPCVATCPVEPDAVTGRRALYRHQTLQTIVCDYDRCIGCGSCAVVCGSSRGGVIARNPATGKPERICNLCGGDPSCVKYCTYGALSYREVEMGMELRNMTPDAIARKLIAHFYEIEVTTI